MINIEYNKTNRLFKKIMDKFEISEFSVYFSSSFKLYEYYNCYYEGNHTVITIFGISFYIFY